MLLTKSELLDEKEKTIDKKIKEFSLEKLHEARDLEELIHARKLKLEDIEHDIKVNTAK